MLDVNAAFTALADPTRRAILARLAQGESPATQLAKPFNMTQPAISHHLKVLERAGLITRRVDGQRRMCQLAPEGIGAIDAWLDMLRKALEANYNRLDGLLAVMNTPKSEEPS